MERLHRRVLGVGIPILPTSRSHINALIPVHSTHSIRNALIRQGKSRNEFQPGN